MTNFPPVPKLRRSLSEETIRRSSVEEYMVGRSLDLSHSSNFDLTKLRDLISRSKFKHPRAKQLAAAARAGWLITASEYFDPVWLNERIVTYWNLVSKR